MRRLLVVALLLAGLLAPPAVLAQIGGAPGITVPPTSLTGGTIGGQTNATGAVFTGATPFCFEGATDNAFETCIAITDPTAPRTFTLPNISGTALISGTNVLPAATVLSYDDLGVVNSLAVGPGGQSSISNTVGAESGTVSVGFAEASAQAVGATQTGAFLLSGGAASSSFLTFTNVATPTNVITLSQDSSAPSLTQTVADTTDTTEFRLRTNGESYILASADSANLTSRLQMEPGDNQAWLRIVDTAGGDSAEVRVETDQALAWISATGPTGSGRVYVEENGAATHGLANCSVRNNHVGPWAGLVNNGFVLDGTVTPTTPPDEVDVIVVDTTPSIIDGDILVCGYATAGDQTSGTKTCETLDFSAGAGTLTTVGTWVEITDIKASSFNVLGGGGDETVAAAWDGDAASILAAVNLTNSAKTDYTATEPNTCVTNYNYVEMRCVDIQGCDFTLQETGEKNGHELQIVLLTGTTSVVFADVDGQMELAGDANDTLNALDTIRFIYSSGASAWLQTALSEN